MTRPEITKTLTDIVKAHISKHRGYYATEVTFDYLQKRIDVLAFYPQNETPHGIESGTFVGYEIKSCKADFESGYGVNDLGDENFLVMTAQTWLAIKEDFMRKAMKFGVLVAIPQTLRAMPTQHDVAEWLLNPSEFTDNPKDWHLVKIHQCYTAYRKKGFAEMLFMMMKAIYWGR